MEFRFHQHIQEIPAQQWNALLCEFNPLISHEFLAAMEQHGCVSETFGWMPLHAALYEDDQLVAAMPLYLKSNNYGEFVFDHAWSSAYQQAGIGYYPKLVSAVPYTPAFGERLLCKGELSESLVSTFLQQIQSFSDKNGISGFHCLFPNSAELDCYQQQHLMIRHDCQYHWHNQAYESFDDFLAQLVSRKRKNIKKERTSVEQQGITFRWLDGHTAKEKDWVDVTRFYNNTFEEKWGMATFNLGFFQQIGKTLPENILLVLADDTDGQCIAGALMYISESHLYGRHWGCDEQVDNLHFETCYYQGIEYCIKHGLKVFEPGAQGEHKVARGFVPTLTRSAHWMRPGPFDQALQNFCEQERQAVFEYIDQLNNKLPYRQQESS